MEEEFIDAAKAEVSDTTQAGICTHVGDQIAQQERPALSHRVLMTAAVNPRFEKEQ